MPDTPTPNYMIPRYLPGDLADLPAQYNAGIDRVDLAVKADIDARKAAILGRYEVVQSCKFTNGTGSRPVGKQIVDAGHVPDVGGVAPPAQALADTFYLRASDHTIPGFTTKMRLEATLVTADSASLTLYVWAASAIYEPVTNTFGTILASTILTQVFFSAAAGARSDNSGDFTFLGDGSMDNFYCFGYNDFSGGAAGLVAGTFTLLRRYV